MDSASKNSGTASRPTNTANAPIQAGRAATSNAVRRRAARVIQAAGSSAVSRALALAVQRVVSLAPSLSEIVVELGAADLLVGVLDGGERPAVLAEVPSVGHYGQLNMERLLSLKPDLILLWPGSVGPAQREQLQRLNIPVYVAEPHSLEQLTTQVQAIAEQLGRADAGRQLAAQLRLRLAELRQRYQRAEPLRVFYQVWNQPLYTVGGGQIISDALGVCGARNVFDDLKLPAPQVSIESVLQRNPEVILAGAVQGCPFPTLC